MSIHFTKISEAIIAYMSKADSVKICSAWFTSRRLLEALESFDDAELIIGSKDRLLPGPSFDRAWVNELRSTLHENVWLYLPPIGDDETRPGIMHHKFIVLMKNGDDGITIPYAFLTGSYNYTEAASSNIENVVYIENKELARAYLDEFTRVKSLSTKLRSLTS
jgi:phosphatidylserine/phosphatidylglycerophosphate/cardiolipin synthase-like enzyme